MSKKQVNKPKRLSQKEMVLRHLQDVGHITSWEAIMEYGCTRLSSVIYYLRRTGFKIISHRQSQKNRYGYRVSYAVYQFLADKKMV